MTDFRKRWAKATRLEDTRLWLASRLKDQADIECLERQITSAIERSRDRDQSKHWNQPENIRKHLTDYHAGKSEGYAEIKALLDQETEETFSFASFATKLKPNAETALYRPTVYVSEYLDNFHVVSGLFAAYENIMLHLRVILNDGEYMIYDRKPRHRKWKDGKYGGCASPTT